MQPPFTRPPSPCRKSSLIRRWGWLLLWAVLYGPGQVGAQLIDSRLDPDLAGNEAIRQAIEDRRGFEVTLIKPQLVEWRGRKMKDRLGTFYIYLLKVSEFRIEGVPIRRRQAPAYLLAASEKSKFDGLPDSVHTRALFVKGMFDAVDSAVVDYYRKQVQELHPVVDSLAREMRALQAPDYDLEEKFTYLDQIYQTARYYQKLYTTFLTAKRLGYLMDFFLSKLYNRRAFHTDVVNAPYGLPRLYREMNTAGGRQAPVTEAALMDADGSEAETPDSPPPAEQATDQAEEQAEEQAGEPEQNTDGAAEETANPPDRKRTHWRDRRDRLEQEQGDSRDEQDRKQKRKRRKRRRNGDSEADMDTLPSLEKDKEAVPPPEPVPPPEDEKKEKRYQ